MAYADSFVSLVLIVFVVLLLPSVFAPAANAGELLNKITGEVEVKTRVDDSRQPTTAPAVLYVQGFELGYDNTSQDTDGPGRRIIKRVLPRLSQRNDAQQKAAHLVELIEDKLVEALVGYGIDARRCMPGAPLPDNGWIIRGVFTEIDQGRRIMRATIGFGAGSTSMEVYVSLSDLAKNPDAPFVIFGTEKNPGMIPGAVVTMNPYVAAAKFVMEKNASEKDVKKTAAKIAQAIMNYIGSLEGKGNAKSP